MRFFAEKKTCLTNLLDFFEAVTEHMEKLEADCTVHWDSNRLLEISLTKGG